MESLLQDLRYALRTLSKAPAFTGTAVITLALGVGATAAAFTLLNWVRFRPLPDVRDPGALGFVWFAVRTSDGFMPSGLSAAEQDRLLKGTPALRALAGQLMGAVNIAVPGSPARTLRAEFVTGDYFDVLGAAPASGRVLQPADGKPGGDRVVVISAGVWQSEFGGRPDVAGKPVQLNGLPFAVAGVMKPGFVGVDRFHVPDIWIPGNLAWVINRAPCCHSALSYYETVARLAPGATFKQAEEQLKASLRPLVADTSEHPVGETATVFPSIGLPALGRDPIVREVDLLMGIGLLLLLVTAANIANLLMFRRAHRQGETFIRLALGASRVRLARYLLAENLLIGLVGGGLGMLVAWWLGEGFRHFRLLGFIRLDDLHPNWRVLAFAVAVGCAASLAAGMVALVTPDPDLADAIKASTTTRATTAPRLRSALAVFQVAVSVSLVTGALLLARTLAHYANVPLGFDPEGVAHFDVDPGSQGYSPAATQNYLRALTDRVERLAGVQAVALTSQIPFSGIRNTARVTPAGDSARPVDALSNSVSEDYFTALRIPVLQGRAFQRSDLWPDPKAAVGKVILSETLARRLFPGRSPLGALVRLPGGQGRNPAAVVIGVVGDTRWGSLKEDPGPLLYQPFPQGGALAGGQLVIRANGVPVDALTREIGQTGRALDPVLPITPWGSLSETVAASLSTQNTLFAMAGVLGGLAVLLAGVGVYALVGYGVTTRTREFGIRMALGADGRAVIRTAIHPSWAIIFAGVGIGVIGALYLTRFIALWIYGVSRYDPLSFSMAAVILGSAVWLASWIPARRAAAVDPVVALRAE